MHVADCISSSLYKLELSDGWPAGGRLRAVDGVRMAARGPEFMPRPA
jgi:hypothetical protein